MKTPVASYLALAITAALSGYSVHAYAEQPTSEKVEVIEVKGIRGSLSQALNNKRFTDSVIDSISAEDIGKFPDKNIGDALQRIPGVTVSRDFSEVDGVTVRGTAPQHSMVLLNGQNVASVGWFDLAPFNRSFNFELLSAEQIGGLDVYKSVEADINEGALGGTINLKTRRPLSVESNTFFASTEGAYSKSAGDWTANGSGLYSWKNDNENLGFLVAHSVENQSVYRETLRSFGEPLAKPADSLGNIPVAPGAMASILFDEERKRESSQVTLQYQATEQLQLIADYNKFTLENDHVNTAMFAIPALLSQYDGTTAVVNDKGVTTRVTTVPFGGAQPLVPLFNNAVLRKPEMEMDVLNLTAEYQTDSWSLNAVIGQSTAKSRGLQSSTWWGNIAESEKTGFTFDTSGPLELELTHPDYALDHEQMMIHNEFSYLNNIRDNDINYYQIDVVHELDFGIFTSIKSGIKYQDQEFSARIDRYDDGILASAMNDGLTLADYNGGIVSGLHSKEGRDGTLSSFAVINKDIWQYAKDNQGALRVTEAFLIDESILSAYAKANFSGDGFRGNIGVRIVETDVNSTGEIDGKPSTGKKSYTNILPSINVVADVTEDLLVRFAAGSSVARPDYDQMKMSASLVPTMGTATIGNPDIEPYKSDQYDLGIEWYFDPSSLLGATLFKKNISDYIYTTAAQESLAGCSETCLVTRSRNVGTADVSGVEFQYQQDFGNGFGMQFNYTYTDSSLINPAGQKERLDRVSQNSFNVSGYYENEDFSARIAYNARDEWQSFESSALATNKPYYQLDASFVWHVTDNVDISIEGVNILNEARVTTLPEYSVYHSVDEYGARYFVGASVKF
ncbi:TonB-dependent receptor [Thalassotalea sp. 1_MG-2023]|uniref:TonB-dependent receptor n=1 Tax=Thalassotalea sp. 1_MG-2023 TaxID=3062680 RepID=UPI0026E267AE|nr:TonB-dependent receptor [Thalassotalea sp. 1_MG-2023]MDO6425879.1 TonB-dependent receptor [Thalassotalea sp. 1_MG-2023]